MMPIQIGYINNGLYAFDYFMLFPNLKNRTALL